MRQACNNARNTAFLASKTCHSFCLGFLLPLTVFRYKIMNFGIIARKTLSDCVLFAIQVLLSLLVVGLPCFVLQRLLVYGIPYSYMPHLLFYIIPECLQFLLPLSLLLGVIITFARMGAESEIMLLKSSGLQPTRLVYPILIMTFLVSFGAWYINDIYAICRERGIRNVILNGAEDIVYGMLKTNGEINTRQIRIKADSVKDGYLYGVSIHYTSSPLSTPIDIEAQTARIQTDKIQREFIIELSNSVFRRGKASGGSYRKKDYYSIPIDALLSGDAASNITNAPMLSMLKQLNVLNKDIKNAQENIAGNTAVTLLTGEFSMFDSDSMQSYRSNLKNYSSTYKKAIIEPYRRFTMGFSCFCLIPLSAALAIYFYKMNIYTNAFISSLLSAGPYFFLFAMGLNFGKQGLAPPWVICIADAFPLVTGFIMLQYVSNK